MPHTTDFIKISPADRDALHRTSELLAALVKGYDLAAAEYFPLDGTAALTGGPKAAELAAAGPVPKAKRKPYTPAQRERALGKVRKYARRKHKHPIAAASLETGIPHKTLSTWCRAAGLVK